MADPRFVVVSKYFMVPSEYILGASDRSFSLETKGHNSFIEFHISGERISDPDVELS
jgi:hypothetical protein